MIKVLTLILVIGFSLQSFAGDCAPGYDPKDPIIEAFNNARNKPINEGTWRTEGGIEFAFRVKSSAKKGKPGDITIYLKDFPPSLKAKMSDFDQIFLTGAIESSAPFAVSLCRVNGQLQFQFVGIIEQRLAKSINVTPDPDHHVINLQVNAVGQTVPDDHIVQ